MHLIGQVGKANVTGGFQAGKLERKTKENQQPPYRPNLAFYKIVLLSERKHYSIVSLLRVLNVNTFCYQRIYESCRPWRRRKEKEYRENFTHILDGFTGHLGIALVRSGTALLRLKSSKTNKETHRNLRKCQRPQNKTHAASAMKVQLKIRQRDWSELGVAGLAYLPRTRCLLFTTVNAADN